jgi:hypothetical protein
MLQTKGKMNDDRIKRLKDLDFVWDSNQERWNTMIDHMKEFIRVHGRVRVPDKYVTADGAQLGWWARTQKTSRKGNSKHYLSGERIAELDAIGFVWASATEEQWNIMFDRLGQFNQQYGHTNVPRCYKGDGDNVTHLGRWVGQQREKENKMDASSMTRKEKLDSIGFLWDPMNIESSSSKKPRLQY